MDETIKEVVNLKRLLAKVSFDLDNFEVANLEQPRLYLEAGRFITQALLEKGRAEYQLDTMEAQFGMTIRAKGEKTTEKAIANQTAVDKAIQSARKRVYVAAANYEWGKRLVAVFEQRLQILNNLTKIRTAETSSVLRSAKEKAAVDVMRRKAERVREDS